MLPPAVGGSAAHVLALDHALRPVPTSLGAQVASGRYVLDAAPAGAVARFAAALPAAVRPAAA